MEQTATAPKVHSIKKDALLFAEIQKRRVRFEIIKDEAEPIRKGDFLLYQETDASNKQTGKSLMVNVEGFYTPELQAGLKKDHSIYCTTFSEEWDEETKKASTEILNSFL